jgi:prevent-host-death family protein
MKMLPLSEVKDQLSGLVEDAELTHEIVTITKHGRPAAVLMGVDDYESLQETLFWLSQPGVYESIATAKNEEAAGGTVDGEDVLARLRRDAG